MKLDLHTHTTYSDGDLDINGNVSMAKELGLDGIAITDHDNIDSWNEIDENSYPITVIKGVELSTHHKGESVHILGYYLNDGGSYEKLSSVIRKNREDRIKRLDKMIFLLSEMGINLTREDILKEADGAVARPHVAKAIMKKYPELGLTSNDIFDKYIGNNSKAYVPVNDFQTSDAIKLLKDNHCLVVLAHPLLIKKFDYKELLDLGLDGIECFYKYDFDSKEDVLKFALDNNLVVTGGSDYHGPKTRNSIGKAYLEGEKCKVFLKHINKENNAK